MKKETLKPCPFCGQEHAHGAQGQCECHSKGSKQNASAASGSAG